MFLLMLAVVLITAGSAAFATDFPDLKFFPVHSNTSWPTANVNGQLIDRQGLAWLTTQSSGLLRYDGNTVRQCLPPQLSSLTLHDMSVDPDNNLYISAGEGLIRYNPLTGHTRHFLHTEGDPFSLADDDKPFPFVDSRHRVWVSGPKGLQRLNPVNSRFTNYQTPPLPAGLPIGEFNHLETLAEDHSGDIWVASAYGLYRVDTVSQSLVPYYSGQYVWLNIFVDSKGHFWVGSWGGGLMKFDPLTRVYTRVYFPKAHNILLNVCEYTDTSGRRWIAFLEDGSYITLVDPESGKSRRYRPDESAGAAPLARTFRWLYADQDNRLWVATDKGLLFVDNIRQQINTYPLYRQTHGEEVYYGQPRFLYEHQGEIWLSLWFRNGLTRYSSGWKLIDYRLRIPPLSGSFYSQGIYFIREDERGNTWYTTDSGLVKQTGPRYTVFMPEEGFQVDGGGTSFRNVLSRRDSTWWVRSLRQGMFVFDPKQEKFIRKYPLPPGVSVITAARFDKDKNLWIGTDKGLFFFDEAEGLFKSFPLQNLQITGQRLLNYIQDIYLDDLNRIWLATYAGFAVFEIDKRQFRYPVGYGSPGFVPCHRLLQDDRGIIWILAEGKLMAYNPETGRLRVFGSEAGLPRGFDYPGVFRKAADGHIQLSYMGGISTFDPVKLLQVNPQSNHMLITELYGDNVQIPIGSSDLRIPAGTSRIRIGFAFVNYSIPEQNVLYYKLYKPGEESEWQPSNGELNLVNLSPGSYILELRGENQSLNLPAVKDTYTLTVLPLWYQSGLFKILLAVVLLGVLYLFNRWRVRNIRESVAVRQRILETEMEALKAQMNPHFMFNCMNSIDAFIQTNDKYNASIYLNKFARLLRNVLESSKENLVPFSKDLETLKLYVELEELRNDQSFRTEFEVDQELMEDDYRVPPLIIQPFVENAILHGLRNRPGTGGILKISMKKEPDGIAYTIDDNGIGRVAAEKLNKGKEKSYGLDMSYARVRLFNKTDTAAIEIRDLYERGIPAGTKVEVKLKMA